MWVPELHGKRMSETQSFRDIFELSKLEPHTAASVRSDVVLST